MLGVIVWALLIIFIAACILLWWFIPATGKAISGRDSEETIREYGVALI